MIEPARNAGRLIAERIELLATWEEHTRRWTPLNHALSPAEAAQFTWKAETGTIQTYRHLETHRNIHIGELTGQFHSEDRTPISQSEALHHAMPDSNTPSRSDGPAQRVKSGIAHARSADDVSHGFGI